MSWDFSCSYYPSLQSLPPSGSVPSIWTAFEGEVEEKPFGDCQRIYFDVVFVDPRPLPVPPRQV